LWQVFAMPDHVALVTGGSRGIGRAISLDLARTHAVAVNYNSGLDEAKETVSAIENTGGEALLVQGDVADKTSVDTMFTVVEEALGPVTALVNNAGIRRDTLAARMSEEDWSEVISIDLSGAFFCARRAMRSMISKRFGRIVNVSSIAGLRGVPGQANYSAAKAGLIGLTKSLAREVGRKNVTVNVVAPGLVETDLTTSLDEKRYADIVREIPAGRAATPDEIAMIVGFLCSERAAYVNGAVVVADGGMTA
jgi:3-oxoacyl-[acyl-carrier protein] reductase